MNKKDNISILYVEDQNDVRLFLSKILSRHFSKVFLAENGKEGLEFYKANKPDIIISDIKMPVMDGLSMSARIKEIDPTAKIILTTAHSDMEYFLHSIDIGINQYILKPIDRDKLFAAIESCANQVLIEKEVEKKRQEIITTNEKLVKQERELRQTLQKTIALKELISRNEENFHQLAENIQDAFWLTDNNKLMYVNQAFETIFEIETGKFHNNPSIFMEIIHPEDIQDFHSALNQHTASQSGSLQYEFRIVLPNGNIKNIWYRDLFFSCTNKKEYCRAVTVSDISEKKQNEQLQQEIMLSEKSMKVKHKLLTNVSHEMRTPLTGIMAMTDFLLKTKLDKNQSDYANTIKQSGYNLLEIINDLLDLNVLEEGIATVKPIPISTESLISSFKNLFDPLANQKGISLTWEHSEGFPEIFIADENKVSRVIRSLISNAIKFTHKGGVHIVLKHDVGTDNNLDITIKIEDTGIGISENSLDLIFQLFAREDDSQTRSNEGLGLGLTICKKLAGVLNGRIDVKSSLNRGSTFSFSFPAEKSASPKKKENRLGSKNPIPALNASVLYAEDKEVNQRVVIIMLELAGCKVDIAKNGQEALEMYQQKPYDIILMDIQMPIMDGITATRMLKKQHKNLPPVIGISANALRADADHYIKQGLDDYISKPVAPALLYEKIDYWLKAHKAGDSAISSKELLQYSIPQPDNSQIKDLDMSVLDELFEQTKDNPEIIADLYKTFLVESQGLMDKIQKSAQENNYKKLQEFTHALKGLSATVGASKIYFHTSNMDNLHKTKNFSESKLFIAPLIKDFERVKNTIQEKFALDDK